MKISEFINLLSNKKDQYGDLECYIKLWDELLDPKIYYYIDHYFSDKKECEEKYFTIRGSRNDNY